MPMGRSHRRDGTDKTSSTQHYTLCNAYCRQDASWNTATRASADSARARASDDQAARGTSGSSNLEGRSTPSRSRISSTGSKDRAGAGARLGKAVDRSCQRNMVPSTKTQSLRSIRTNALLQVLPAIRRLAARHVMRSLRVYSSLEVATDRTASKRRQGR